MNKENIIVASVVGGFVVVVLVLFTYVFVPGDKREVSAVSDRDNKTPLVEYDIPTGSRIQPVTAVQRAANEASTSASPAPQPPAAQNAGFRKELFEKAHRVAVEYDIGDEVKLMDELELIESAVSGEKEANAFKVFKFIAEVQQDLMRLEGAKIATERMVSKFDELPGQQKALIKSVKPEFAAFGQVKSRGGVVVGNSGDSSWAEKMSPLVEKWKFVTTETDGLTWIPYESSKFKLLALEKATLETAGAVINNNGNVKD